VNWVDLLLVVSALSFGFSGYRQGFVVGAGRAQARLCSGNQRRCVGAFRAVARAEQRVMGPCGCGAQRVCVGQTVFLGREGRLLARLRVDGLDLVQAEPQQVSLLRTFTATGGEHAQLVVEHPKLVECVGVRSER